MVVLAITCGSCDAFRTSIPVAMPARLRLARRRATMEASAPTTAESSDKSAQSSYPGPMIPRVGGDMPEQRPGWFRVPAPGGKHTKVRLLACTSRTYSVVDRYLSSFWYVDALIERELQLRCVDHLSPRIV